MESPLPAELAEFPVAIELPVQWGDQDAFGHVNNTVYFRWFESARIAYLEKMDLDARDASGGLGPILAAISCNYRQQVTFPDRVQIGSRVVRIGRTSLTMEHRVWSTAQRALVADGQATVVVFDYATGKPQPVPEPMRAVIAQLEGRAI